MLSSPKHQDTSCFWTLAHLCLQALQPFCKISMDPYWKFDLDVKTDDSYEG